MNKNGNQKLKELTEQKKDKINPHIPIIANIDFDHTEPRVTLPIEGEIKIEAHDGKAKIEIL